MNAEIRALTAAMELLRQQMANLPLAILQNMQDGASGTRRERPPAAGSAGGAGAQGFAGRAGERAAVGTAALALSFSRLLGPLAALGTFLSASTSGFSVFNKAIQLFGATLAPILLPAFFLLSVALAAVSEVLFTALMPAMQGFFTVILNYGLPIIVRFIDMILSAAEALEKISDIELGGGVKGSDALATAALLVPGFQIPAAMYLADRAGGGTGDGRAFGAAVGGGTRAEAGAAVGRGMADTLAELRLSMAPKAQSGSVQGVYERAQMALLNQSPFERRMLEMMTRVVDAMSRAATEPGRGLLTPAGAGAGGGMAARIGALTPAEIARLRAIWGV